MTGRRGAAAWPCAAALIAGLAAEARARDAGVGSQARRQANAALALLSVSMSPNESASALYLDSNKGGDFNFTAAQVGGGFTLKGAAPLYLEGYVAASRYDPEIILGADAAADAEWRNLSVTGGIGWSFPIAPHLTARPILDLAFGSISAQGEGLAPLAARAGLRGDDDFGAWGLGASAMLDYSRAYADGIELDSELRLTLMRLESFDKVFGVSASADAASLGSWNRVRAPTGWEAFDRPLRAVGELSASWLPGDQGEALRTRWLVQAGGGLEVDFSAQGAPWPQRARLMLRGVVGERLTGVSLGVGLSF